MERTGFLCEWCIDRSQVHTMKSFIIVRLMTVNILHLTGCCGYRRSLPHFSPDRFFRHCPLEIKGIWGEVSTKTHTNPIFV